MASLRGLSCRDKHALNWDSLCRNTQGHDANALPGVLVEDKVLTGRGQREFLDSRFGGCNAFCRTTPKHTTRIDFENVVRKKHSWLRPFCETPLYQGCGTRSVPFKTGGWRTLRLGYSDGGMPYPWLGSWVAAFCFAKGASLVGLVCSALWRRYASQIAGQCDAKFAVWK